MGRLRFSVPEVALLALVICFLAPVIGVIPGLSEVAVVTRWPLLAGVFVLFALSRPRVPRRSPFNPVRMPLRLWFAAAALSSLFSHTPIVCFLKLGVLALMLATLFEFAPRRLAPLQWVRVLAIMGVLMTSLTVPTILRGDALMAAGYRTVGFLETNPNAVGAVAIMGLGLILPFTNWLFATGRGRWAVAVLAAVALTFWVLLATGSRGASAAGTVATLAWLTSLRLRRRRLIMALVLVGGAATLLFSRMQFVHAQLDYLFRERGFEIDSFDSRSEIWAANLEAWGQRPILGWGYASSAVARELQGLTFEAFTVRDGSGWFGMLESVGLLGVGLFGLTMLPLLRIHRHFVRMADDSLLRAGGLAGTICLSGLAVNHIGEPWLLGPGSAMSAVFWLCLAATVCLYEHTRGAATMPVQPANETPRPATLHRATSEAVVRRRERNQQLAARQPREDAGLPGRTTQTPNP